MKNEKMNIVKAITDENYPQVIYETEAKEWDYKIVETNPKLTLLELAEFCDHNAEQRNAHEFCQSHILLAALLYKIVGEITATKIIREISERGGLDGMSGICGFDKYDSYKEFGLIEGRDIPLDYKFTK